MNEVDERKKVDKVIVSGRKLWAILGAILALSAPYAHYYGYSYLKGKLLGVGFSDPQVNLNSFDMLGIFFSTTVNPVLDILNGFLNFQDFKFFVVIFIISVPFVLLYLKSKKQKSKKIDEFNKGNEKTEDNFYKKDVRKNKINSKNKLKDCMLLSLDVIDIWLRGVFVYLLAILVISLIVCIPWLFGLSGKMVGYQEGREMLEANRCEIIPDDKLESYKKTNSHNKILLNCVVVYFKNSNDKEVIKLTGVKLHRNKNGIVYFLTENKAIEINSKDIISTERYFFENEFYVK
ncbi:hypothetical protein [Marinicellulosiphila megalodicopiae]|uniref:hypothetical protein n=1 Tax=Marinicellulosiphila megalodicopiae TaxID=2724896 RepID=UPI003BAEF711